jgi:GntR family transcriptional regulator/MocR family aminotransferase
VGGHGVGNLLKPGDRVQEAKCLTDWHTPLPTQAALARFIDEGKLARHVRKMRAEYQARHRRITDILRRDFAGVLEPVPSAAGLHLSAAFRAGTAADILAAARRARPMGVFCYTLSQFTMEAAHAEAQPGLIIGYGAAPLDRIDEGLRRLRACLPGT